MRDRLIVDYFDIAVKAGDISDVHDNKPTLFICGYFR